MNNENNNIVKKSSIDNNTGVVGFDISELPQIITKQVNKMTVLERKIKQVMKEADIAKEEAQKANKKISIFSGKKVAIEELQTSANSLANAIQFNAEALQSSFEFQKELADISKFLFGLGAWNIAQNRMVVRELELKMKDASQIEISELAKQELLTVVRQLKAQEDLLSKQEQFNKKLKEFNKQLDIVSEKSMNIAENVISLKETDKRHDEEISKLFETDKMHDEELAKQKETDKMHDEELAKQKETDKMHDKELAKQKETDKIHDEELAKQKETDKYHSFELQEQKKTIKHQELLIDKLINQAKHLNLKMNFILLGFIIVIIIFIILRYFSTNI